MTRIDVRIRSPRQFVIGWQMQRAWQINIPSLVDGSAIWRAVFRQEIIIVRHKKERRLSPLPEIVPAGNRLRRGLGATDRE